MNSNFCMIYDRVPRSDSHYKRRSNYDAILSGAGETSDMKFMNETWFAPNGSAMTNHLIENNYCFECFFSFNVSPLLMIITHFWTVSRASKMLIYGLPRKNFSLFR